MKHTHFLFPLMVSLLLFIFLQGCGFLGDNEIIISPTLVSVEETNAGMLITFTPGTEREVDYSGADLREVGETFFSVYDQTLQEGANNNQILISDLPDGILECRIFVASGDFYGYSEVFQFEAVSPNVDVPCSVPVNTTISNAFQLNCNEGQVNVSLDLDYGFSPYTILTDCPSAVSRFYFEFPREPSSGVYSTTTLDMTDYSPSDRFVRITYTSEFGGQRFVEFGESLYVNTMESTVSLNACDLPIIVSGTSARFSGRYDLQR